MPADVRVKFGIVCVIRDQVADRSFKKGAAHCSTFRLLAPACTTTPAKALEDDSQTDAHKMVTTYDDKPSNAAPV